MLKTVTLITDPTLPPEQHERLEVESLCALLKERFGEKLPDFARIYTGSIAKMNDVTPYDRASIKALREMEGPFFIVVYPGAPAYLAFFLVVVAIAAYVLAKPPPYALPPGLKNQTQGSPNNGLSDRTNQMRINGRIPDIFGQVRSFPDLISEPYRIFENNAEVEYSLMCIGRGYFEVEDVRDGDTLCVNIPGTTVMVYDPFTSPNKEGASPILTIGQQRSVPVLRTKRNNSVNGQVLRPPNASTYQATGNVRFTFPNLIEMLPNSADDFTKFFVSGDQIVLTGAVVTSGDPVEEHYWCQAGFQNLGNLYTNGGISGSYGYQCAGGALLLPISNEAEVYALFAPGSSITIAQTVNDSRWPGFDISGTYEVLSLERTELPQSAKNAGLPEMIIVKLVDPETVNTDWLIIDEPMARSKAPKIEIDVTHAGADVDYSINLNGTFDVVSVTKNYIVLSDPESVNSAWGSALEAAGSTPFLSPTIETTEQGRWVGRYIMTDIELTKMFCNFVAQGGLYKDDGVDQVAETVKIEVEVTPVDVDDIAIGDPEIFTIDLVGSATLKETVAVTMQEQFSSFYGRCAVRARRITPHDDAFEGNVVDEVRWRDLYSVAAISLEDFGNVTTVQSVVFATASALAVKERKLNMLVTRRLPVTTFFIGIDLETEEEFKVPLIDDVNLIGTRNAADILVAICRDRFIGNRQPSEIDIVNIFETVEALEEYFGTPAVRDFSYTFDDDGMSFQEIVDIVAQAIFCTAYRRGNVIKLHAERSDQSSVLLFNHRNKIPDTEKRNRSFGNQDDCDGVEFSYTNPADDLRIPIFLPLGYTAVNPKRIDSLGVRNHIQAYFHAWRAWQKVQHQRLMIEFQATQECQVLVRNEKFLATDGTLSGSQEGDLLAIDGFELTLSQPADFSAGGTWTLFLQLPDGTIESFGVTAGDAANKVIIDAAPSIGPNVDPEAYARATYIIVKDDDTIGRAFLLTERSAPEGLVSTVRGVNFDPRFYEKDVDFINEVISGTGYDPGDAYGPGGGFVPQDPDDSPYTPPPDPPELLVGPFSITTGQDGNFFGYKGNGGGSAGSLISDGGVLPPMVLGVDVAANTVSVTVSKNGFSFTLADIYAKYIGIDLPGMMHHYFPAHIANETSEFIAFSWSYSGVANWGDAESRVATFIEEFPAIPAGASFELTPGRDNWIGGTVHWIGFPGDNGASESYGAINGAGPIVVQQDILIPGISNLGLVASGTNTGGAPIDRFVLQVFMSSGDGNDFPGPNVTRIQVEGVGTFNIADAVGLSGSGPPSISESSWAGRWNTSASLTVGVDATITFLGPP